MKVDKRSDGWIELTATSDEDVEFVKGLQEVLYNFHIQFGMEASEEDKGITYSIWFDTNKLNKWMDE